MTDTDRGAYTPHHDAPLAFDARRPSDRRPLPMTLIASAGVLVLVGGALVMAYRGGIRGSEAPKAVGEPLGVIKTAAPAGSPAEAGGPMDVYAAQNVPTSAPNFTPPPEQPVARPTVAAATPAPTQLTVKTVEPAKIRIEPSEPAAAPAPAPTAAERLAAVSARTAIPAGAADGPVQVAKAEPAPARPAVARSEVTAPPKPLAAAVAPARPAPAAAKTEAPAKIVVAKTSVAKPEPATKPAEAKAVAKGGAAVQIGAFSSHALADKGYADAAKLSSLGGHARAVETVQHDGHTFYRATLTGFADKAAAKAFCATLTAKGGRCIVKS